MSIPSEIVNQSNSDKSAEPKKLVTSVAGWLSGFTFTDKHQQDFSPNHTHKYIRIILGKIYFCLDEFKQQIQQTSQHIRDIRSGFDAGDETLFWEEHHPESLSTLKAALLLGIIGFIAFIALDFFTKGLGVNNFLLRMPIIIVLLALLLGLQRDPLPAGQIGKTAKLGAGFTILNLVITTLNDQNPLLYTENWTGLIPIYFFIYGQLFMTVTETVLFGWLAMLILPLSALLTGVEISALMPSILILLLINLFGYCTRCQLEIHARRGFLAKRKARIADLNKTMFLQQFSHNIRQPLQALSCQSTVLETACSELHLKSINLLAGKMGDNIDELNKTFNNILTLTNLETGIQKPMQMPVDINLLLSSLEYQFAAQATASGLQLKVKLRTNPPYNIYTDYTILRQILSNLIDNAIKYTRNGWVLVTAVKMPGKYLKVHVCDSGRGFSDVKPRPERKNDPPIPGYGIGLTYVKKAITSLPGHSITVVSKLDRGSDFRIKLPIAEQGNAVIARESKKHKLAGVFVLIVDDDERVLKALEQQIASYGCLVQTAGSLDEVKRILAGDYYCQPDLLISDFCLGNNATAHDIMALLCEDGGDIPTLILSAHSISHEDKVKLPKQALLLRKPASNTEILEKISMLLAV